MTTTQNYRNADPAYARIWDQLVDLSTHRTLFLAPDEATTQGVATWDAEGELTDLPPEFHDEYLVPVTTPAAPAAKTAKTASTTDDTTGPKSED